MAQDNQHFSSSMPVLSRLDRLDRLLQYLEEKQQLSQKSSSPAPTEREVEKQCKPLSSALEEVQFRGTLMERLAMLENRVLQLSFEMEEGNTSSSSTIPFTEYVTQGSSTKQDVEGICNNLEKKDEITTKEKAFEETQASKYLGNCKSRRRKGKPLPMSYRKWLGWFQMGC